MTPGRTSRREGFRSSSPQDQVLRNHSVGKTRRRAASGPRLCTVMRTRMSSGPSFAYSTNTSKIPVVAEDPRIEQLVFELSPRSSPVRFDQVQVGILALRVLVEILHVRVGGRAVEVEVVLLDVLAVVRLTVGESEQALFQDRVPLVPQGQGEAEPLLVIREAREPVPAPPGGSVACLAG